MKLNLVVIPKKFKIDNYIIELKNEILGRIIIPENNEYSYFRGNIYRILVKLNKRNANLLDLKEFILSLYLRGIKDARQLSKEELGLFYFIKDVKDMTDNTKTMLFIGYKNNYVSTIKNTLSQFSRCDSIELQKNIELYDENEYNKIYDDIIKKSENYNKIIIDIPNVYLLRDKEKTKKILETLMSKDKKILLLVNRYVDVFLQLFGDEYKNNIINRKYILYSGNDQTVVNKMKQILF